MKFKNKKGVVIEPRNAYEESILKSNPNYTVVNENVEKAAEPQQKNVEAAENSAEVKASKKAKKGGNEPSL